MTRASPASDATPRRAERGLPGLVRLAWRSLGRQRRRTALLVLVVAYATIALLFFWGMTDGFLTSIYQSQARLVGAPVQISTPDHHVDPDPLNALPSIDDLARTALDVGGVTAVTPRLDVPVLLRSAYAARGAQLRGVDPEREASVSDLPGRIGEGRMLRAPGELVLGRELAERLDVRVGERVAVDAASAGGPTALGLRVVGLIDTGISVVDASTVMGHIGDARTLAGVATATTLAAAVAPGAEARVARDLDTRLPDGVRAYPVEAQMGALAAGLATERAGTMAVGLVFSLFAAVAVTSSVVVSVLERTREFGVMLALGMSHRRLGALVTLEAILATLVGYAVGAVVGYALLYWMAEVNVLGPLFTRAWGDLLSDFALGNDIRADVRLEYLGYAAGTVVLAAVGAILTPARRVLGLVPAEAMRTAD